MTATIRNSNDRAFRFNGAGRFHRFFFSVGSIALALGFAFVANAAPRPARFVPGRIIVQPRADLAETNFTATLARLGAMSHRLARELKFHVISVPEENAEATLAVLQNDPEIEFAERDYVAETAFTPNDPYVVSGKEWQLARVHALEAWEFTAGRTDVVVAVLDSGVNAALPEFAGRILPGYDFVWNDADPADDFGHGTAVTGTIVAAGNNGIGIAGVAFGCRVLPVKVVDASGSASYSTIAQGIHYAVDHGARVINLSLAGDSSSALLQDAVNYAWTHNVVIVAAGGNNADNVPQYPAACDHVIGVSATEPDDSLARFSSFGNFISLSAPGDQIWTTQRDPAAPFGSWSGTSFASPIVAAVAALVLSENPTLSNERIVSLLEQTADDAGVAGYDPSFGFGRVNAFRAVAAAANEPGALPPAPPLDPNVLNGNPVPDPGTNSSPEALALLFAPFKGAYAGLVLNSNLVTPDDSGLFAVNVTTLGRFSGQLRIGGRHYGFHGRFDASGHAVAPLKRGRLNPFTVTLQLNLDSATDRIAGGVTDGSWTSELAGNRDVFDPKKNPAPQAGRGNFILQRADNPTITAATASSFISTGGATRIHGRLNAGQGFALGSVLAKSGDVPFCISLNHGSGIIIGWLNFPPATASSPTGSLLWVEPGLNVFTNSLQAATPP